MESQVSVRDWVGRFGRFVPGMVTRTSEAEGIVKELFELAGIQIGGHEPGRHPRPRPALLRAPAARRVGRLRRVVHGRLVGDRRARRDCSRRSCARTSSRRSPAAGGMRALTAKAVAAEPAGEGALGRVGRGALRHRQRPLHAHARPRAWSTPAAYWKNATTLAEAQEAKLDLVVPQARPASPACACSTSAAAGAGFASWAAEKYGCTGRRRDAVEGPGRARQRDVEAPRRRAAPVRLPRRHAARSTASCRSA